DNDLAALWRLILNRGRRGRGPAVEQTLRHRQGETGCDSAGKKRAPAEASRADIADRVHEIVVVAKHDPFLLSRNFHPRTIARYALTQSRPPGDEAATSSGRRRADFRRTRVPR